MDKAEMDNWITQLRLRVANGEQISTEEMKNVILNLRQNRMSAAQTATKSRAKSPARSADALLGDLGI